MSTAEPVFSGPQLPMAGVVAAAPLPAAALLPAAAAAPGSIALAPAAAAVEDAGEPAVAALVDADAPDGVVAAAPLGVVVVVVVVVEGVDIPAGVDAAAPLPAMVVEVCAPPDVVSVPVTGLLPTGLLPSALPPPPPHASSAAAATADAQSSYRCLMLPPLAAHRAPTELKRTTASPKLQTGFTWGPSSALILGQQRGSSTLPTLSSSSFSTQPYSEPLGTVAQVSCAILTRFCSSHMGKCFLMGLARPDRPNFGLFCLQ